VRVYDAISVIRSGLAALGKNNRCAEQESQVCAVTVFKRSRFERVLPMSSCGSSLRFDADDLV